MSAPGIRFSIASHAAWAPGLETPEAWEEWSHTGFSIQGVTEPRVSAMSSLMRRRAGPLGKMALEVAFQCLREKQNISTIFCSRHGEVTRSFDLLFDLAQGIALSPTAFGLSVHNASGGLLSIARRDQANHIALAAGASSVEHAVIEACGLLADGEPMVLLVVYDCPLPAALASFQDCDEQPHAWAWLMTPAGLAGDGDVSLAWAAASSSESSATSAAMPGSLEVLRFHLRQDPSLVRVCGMRQWRWTRHA